MVLVQGSEAMSAILSLVLPVGGPFVASRSLGVKAPAFRPLGRSSPGCPGHRRMVATANLGSACYIPEASHPSVMTNKTLRTLPNVCLWGQNLPWLGGGGSKNHCLTRSVLLPHPSSVVDLLLKIAPTTTSQPVPANFCCRSNQHLTFL